MSILMLLVYLALIGLATWAITLIPMPTAIRNVIVGVAVVIVVLIALRSFGLLPRLGAVPQLQ